MVDLVEEPEIETGAEDGAPPVSHAAVAVALGRTSRKGGKTIDQDASDFLRLQSKLISLQTEHLHEQRLVALARLKLGRWKDRLSLALQVMTILVGIGVAAAVAVMAWRAYEDHGVAIEAFSVPPDLAARGLTGQVVAARVLDRLTELQAQTVSGRPGSSYADNWGDDIKVEIPETGVSIGELNRYLRQWLGHETQVTGEVVRTPAGLSVTARAAGRAGKAIEGVEADVDELVGQAAESVYAQTQPYRYAVYLQAHGQPDQALAAYQMLARGGSQQDRIWAYSGWSEILIERGDNAGAERVLRAGVARDGSALFATGALPNLNNVEAYLGHIQGELDSIRLNLRAARQTGAGNAFVSNRVALRILQSSIAAMTGDPRAAMEGWSAVDAATIAAEGGQVALQPQVSLAEAMIADHDVSGGLRLLAAKPSAAVAPPLNLQTDVLRQAGDWRGLTGPLVQTAAAYVAKGAISRDRLQRSIWPSLAVAEAHLGRLADAQVLVARTPLDCEPCLEARAQVAALGGDWAGADRWFIVLERRAPDIPIYDTDWAAVLLAKGDLAGAIARSKLAHRKGPRFADPLQIWGEALMRQGDHTGAIAKFVEADKDAPRWGRNHLMWGEALMLSGRYAEARRQYGIASGLDLSRPDRAALHVLLARTASGPLHG